MASGLSGLELRRAPRLLKSVSEPCDSCDPRGLSSFKTRGVSHVHDHMQSGCPSYIGTNGESIFFSIDSLPGILASLSKALQSKKASLPMYLNEGGIASSTRPAQFKKASTRIDGEGSEGELLRPVQCTKVNSGISSTLVLQRSALLSSRQLSVKCFVRASAVIPVELRKPGASSLILACSVDPRGDGSLLKVTLARLIHP